MPCKSKACFLDGRLESVNFKCNSCWAKVVGTLVCIAGAVVLTLYKGVSLFDNSQVTNRTMENAIRLSPSKKTQRWTIWNRSSPYRNTFMFFVVPCPIKHREEIPLPLFNHCHHVLLRCHSVCHPEFLYGQPTFDVGSARMDSNHNRSIFRKCSSTCSSFFFRITICELYIERGFKFRGL